MEELGIVTGADALFVLKHNKNITHKDIKNSPCSSKVEQRTCNAQVRVQFSAGAHNGPLAQLVRAPRS